MQKVITMNLNGMAYQLEESGYDSLRAYLAQADQQLAGNADRADILADFEQALAEKCAQYLRPHKNVVTAQEVDDIIKVMGPVDADVAPDATASGPAADTARARPTNDPSVPRRLYRIYEGAWISGICNGLAAYFGLDVTLIRVLFVILTFISGFGVLCYLVLFFVIPSAKTAQERAAAQGARFNAQALIDRAKAFYAGLPNQSQWRRQWYQQRRHWRDQWQRRRLWMMTAPATAPAGVVHHAAPVGPGVLLGIAFVSVFSTALFIGALAVIFVLATTQGWLSGAYPAGAQLMVAGLVCLALHACLSWPVNQMRRTVLASLDSTAAIWAGALDVLLRLVLIGVAVAVAYDSVPIVHDALEQLRRGYTFQIGARS